jgi:NAD(P)-dependent dehydrogenase (short-subunit alcohol dehydrogenase family)
MGRLSGKAAAVTGGASGIGEATARLFAEEGARVAFADMDAERGRMVAEDLKSKGTDVLFVEAHVEREAEAIGFVRQAAERFGRLDVLVNNAGMRLYHSVVDATEQSWDSIIGVNVESYAFCAKAAIPEANHERRGVSGRRSR